MPPELDAIVLKAMAKNPANRYQSAGEMRADLIRAINGRPVEAEPVMTQDEVTTVLAGGARTGQYRRPHRGAAPGAPAQAQPLVLGRHRGRLPARAGRAAFATIKLVGSGNDVNVPNLSDRPRPRPSRPLQDAGLVGDLTATSPPRSRRAR